MKVNMNELVKLKLTEDAIRVLGAHHYNQMCLLPESLQTELTQCYPESEGYYLIQFFEMIEIFGNVVSIASNPITEGNIVVVPDYDLKSRPSVEEVLKLLESLDTQARSIEGEDFGLPVSKRLDQIQIVKDWYARQ